MNIDILEIEIDGSTIYQPTAVSPAGVIISREKQECQVTGSIQVMVDNDGDAVARLLFVRKEHRRSGLGKQLMKTATAIAIANGCRMIYAASSKANRGANAFFEKLQFARTDYDESNYAWSAALPASKREPEINGREVSPDDES